MRVGIRPENECVLRRRFPGLLERLTAPDVEIDPSDFSVVASSRGDPTLSVGGRWLHSRVDPRREAERLAVLAAGDGPLLVLGFGLGYAAESAAAADPSRAVVVAESDARMLALAFSERDLSSFLSRERLAFAVGGAGSEVLAALEAFGGTPALLSAKALRDLNPRWYDSVENAVRAWSMKDEVNAATLRRFGQRWVRNLAANLDSIRDLPGVSRIAGCAEGLPALLAAAGPTLDQVLPYLPAIARRCLIVAADTALRAILASGVDPDFVLVVDPQYWNARHLDRCRAPESALISESAAYPSVLRSSDPRERPPSGGQAFSRSFLCSSLFPLGRFVEDRVDPKGELGAGGSVATTAWDFIRTLGAGPIWTAGLDLGFPELKTHFKGALFEERVHADCARTDPGELRSFKALRDGRPFKAPSADGGEVLTDKRLSLYGAWFESRFARYPQAAPRSLSSGGLRIAGMRVCGISEILALPERRAEMDRRLGEAYARAEAAFGSPEAAESRRALYSEVVRDLTDSLRSLETITETGARTARAAYSRGDSNLAFRELEKTNEAIQSSLAKDVAGFLFPPISELEADLRTDPADAAGRHIELSERIYENLASAARFHLRLLERRKKT